LMHILDPLKDALSNHFVQPLVLPIEASNFAQI
jgi:hypothetical protein